VPDRGVRPVVNREGQPCIGAVGVDLTERLAVERSLAETLRLERVYPLHERRPCRVIRAVPWAI
jgi:hypothetical protein